METKLFKSLWGMSGDLHDDIERIAKGGYDGIEAGLPPNENAKLFRSLLDAYHLDYIPVIMTREDHISSFYSQIEQAAEFNPVLIVSHSAKDDMPYDRQDDFFGKALEWERKTGITVAHETHRGRAMFTPWSTARLLKEFPDLKIAADFSHWCCVCESLLKDQEENLSIAMERAVHIHGRVGYAEGPQITDPRAPEYAEELEAHEKWWLGIARKMKEKGAAYIRFDPEFGGANYMHMLPFTNLPVADLWDVCSWMAQRFRSLVTEI